MKDEAIYRRLFRTALLIRLVEERIIELYPSDKIQSPVHLSIGQEAVAVGVCDALRPDDLVFATYRSHGFYIAKGGRLDAMFAELYGHKGGISGGKAGSMHLAAPEVGLMGSSAVVASTIPHAVGAALSFKRRGSPRLAVAAFGDGATEEGVFHETLNFAGLRKLPLLFICENNLYATNTHVRDRQAQTEIWRHAERYGIPGRRLDGNDVVTVWQAAAEAVARARRGEGPSLLELETYRYFEHCGINEDLDLGYRTAEELSAWRARDPLASGRRLVSDKEAKEMEAEIAARIDRAFEQARSAPWPTADFQEAAR